MGQYSKKGLYSAYDKNNKERQKEDYYSTPTEEVTNILNVLHLDYDEENDIILEPSCGGGHMIEGIRKVFSGKLIGTDIKDRGYSREDCELVYGLDYLSDDYPYNEADYVIMNPPFKLIEPFVIRSLEIAKKGVLMFGRLQFLEGQGRYENIFTTNPPDIIYVYVDRVACFKNGNTSIKPDSVQAYAWFYWDKENPQEEPITRWLRRVGK